LSVLAPNYHRRAVPENAGIEEDRAPRRLRELQRITDATLAFLSPEELLAELLERTTEILQTDTAAFLELDERNQELVARAAKGIEEEVAAGVRIPVGRGFAGRIAAGRKPVVILDVDHADILNPLLRERGIRSLLGVPMLISGRVIGVMHVGTLTPRVFTEDDARLLQLVADRAALAVDHARTAQERRMVEALQRNLVPVVLPRRPDIEFAARYMPSSVAERIGGDWYDAFDLGNGRIGIAIGDVMGRGVEAAMQMAQVRTALRAYAFDGHGPAAVAERLNRWWHTRRPVAMTTLAYLVLDPDREQVVCVSAGHVPPLVVAADGSWSLADVAGDPPLGVTRATRYREHTFALRAGETLVLVTDGAIEVRGEAVDVGLARLGELASRQPDPAGLCAMVAAGAVINRAPDDDLAVLVARLLPLGDRLRARWPAEPGSLADARHVVGRWVRRWTSDRREADDVVMAVQEACSNAVEHAYAPGRAFFEVHARHTDGEIRIEVRDAGRWRAPRGKHRGRGLPIMEALMDAVEVERGDDGTVVRLTRRLGRERA
jgi:serine phosphatase RsbU (regulator of sigma subunit)/anti-sigma regulatory factor (Ser/Thr protein kinase)